MSDSLGLSIGAANLVAVRAGSTPLARESVLTLLQRGGIDVGDPEPGSTDSGSVLRGFVERVGEPDPLVADDGTTHRAEALTAEALDAMAREVGYGAPVSIAVPAYWSAHQIALLRGALADQPGLTPAGGAKPVTIPDATSALAALYSKPGFPTDGVVALCDFGASGTSVTLNDAASNLQQIGPTVRYAEFSGDGIDQLILRNLQSHDGDAYDADRAGTGPMGSLSRRLEECRRAKEQLSAATVTVIPAEMPGFGQDVRLSRAEFERMISQPLDQFVSAVEDILRRNGIPRESLTAAATVGGGACIPLITSRLSERLDVPIFTTSQPAFSTAIGAAELGRQRSTADVPTAAGAPADTVGEQETEIAPAGWAIQAAGEAAEESAADDDPSATYRALAWSQDADSGVVPIPDTGDDVPVPVRYSPAPRLGHWYTRPTMLLGLTGAAAVALLGIVVAAVFKLSTTKVPTDIPSVVTSSVQSSAVEQTSELPPPAVESPSSPPSPAPPPPSTVVTVTTAPPTTWATTRPAPTTTTPPPSTTAPTTTFPITTAPSTYPSTTPTTSPQGTVTLGPTTPRVTPPWGY